MATHWMCGELDAESCDSVETVAQWGIGGQNRLAMVFWTKHDVIVAIATACATMATHWMCGELDAESCDIVETVAQWGIGGQKRLAMVFGQNMTSLLP